MSRFSIMDYSPYSNVIERISLSRQRKISCFKAVNLCLLIKKLTRFAKKLICSMMGPQISFNNVFLKTLN